MYYKVLDIVNSISCFQLAVFSVFLLHKGRKNISNLILATFFLAQLIVIFNYVLSGLSEFGGNFHLKIVYIYYPFEFLWGPLMYFYVKSQIKQGFRFKYAHLIHLIPFVSAALFTILYYYVSDSETKKAIVTTGAIYKWHFYFGFPYYLLLFTYNFSALFLIFNRQRSQRNYYSYVVKRNLDWLKFVMYCYIIFCLLTAITNFANQIITIPDHITLLVLFVPCLIFFNILFYVAMIHPYVIIMPEEKSKQSGSNLNNTEIQNYAKSIETVLNIEKPYLNQTLTLRDLSEATGIAERIISQVINTHWNQNFLSFINSFRIEEAKILLMTTNLSTTTMQGISFDAGFNSKSAFYEAFKKHTGMTPKEYRKMKVG